MGVDVENEAACVAERLLTRCSVLGRWSGERPTASGSCSRGRFVCRYRLRASSELERGESGGYGAGALQEAAAINAQFARRGIDV
jgi:hypothetical protein